MVRVSYPYRRSTIAWTLSPLEPVPASADIAAVSGPDVAKIVPGFPTCLPLPPLFALPSFLLRFSACVRVSSSVPVVRDRDEEAG